MQPEAFDAVFPHFMHWIACTLSAHAHGAKTVASKSFPRIPLYFSRELLTTAKVVVVERVPMPPLTQLGLSQFAEFERSDNSGVTYLDTFFVRRDHADEEPLHFHELIHVIQWRILGPARFLASYAAGLEMWGYRDSPLEVMAYDAEAAFANTGQIFDAERLVAEQLQQCVTNPRQ
jgi:hypothetical protein